MPSGVSFARRYQRNCKDALAPSGKYSARVQTVSPLHNVGD
jgi:hypothetical protein